MKKLEMANRLIRGEFIGKDENKNDRYFSLPLWLSRQLLHGKESRFRTRFLKMLDDRIKEIEEERIKIAKGCAIKDKKNGIIYLDKDNKETGEEKQGIRFKFDETGEEKFTKEFIDYLNEKLILDITPSTSETIYGARDVILNTDDKFQGREALIYDEICECFEAIKDSGKKKE